MKRLLKSIIQKKTTLARRLYFFVFVGSIVLVILFSLFHYHYANQKNLEAVQHALDETANQHASLLIKNLWSYEKDLLNSQVEMMVGSRGISYVELKTREGEVYFAGKKETGAYIDKKLSLVYDFAGERYYLGTLLLEASLVDVINDVWQETIRRSIFSVLEVSLISLMVFGLFYKMAGRRIELLADAVTKLGIRKTSVSKRDEAKRIDGDEIDDLREAVNDLYINLNSSLQEVEGANAKLKQEIDRREIIEIALKESRNQYKALFERSNDAIFIYQPDGKILDVNDTACERLGYEKDELLTFDIYAIERGASPALRAKRTDSMNEKSALIFETEYYCKDGAHIPMEVNARLFEMNHQKAVVAIARDLTSRKKIEEELLHSQKMEAIGRLAGGVAHDFNNRLMVILGYGDVLLKKMNLDQVALDYVEKIVTTARRAGELTRQLLAFGRKQMLRPQVVDMNQVVGDTYKLLQRLIGEDIKIKMELDSEVCLVKIDPIQMEQAIMNLVVNAKDAMPSGGVITIRIGTADTKDLRGSLPSSVIDEKVALLEVIDTGVGIPEGIREKIFEPFYTTKERGKGTGLGLSMVLGFVKQSGGFCYVESEIGQGANFKICLPLSDEELENIPARRPIGTSLTRGMETVLVVEDEKEVRELLMQMFSETGYKVLVAKSGEEALEMAKRENNIDLLITDVVMPSINGRELAEFIKIYFEKLKVIYISGYTNDVINLDNKDNSNSCFLQKPFEQEDLFKKIREVLD